MKLIKTILFFLISGQIFGTSQIPDILIYEEDTLLIYANPLEIYFEKIGSRELPKFKGCSSTACWRGYIAIWELRNDSVFLKEIKSCEEKYCDNLVNADLRELFGDKYQKNEVFADWITSELINPYGELIARTRDPYGGIYECERGFVIKDGILKNINEYDNRKTIRSTFKEEPDSLYRFLDKNINWNLIEEFKLTEKTKVIAQFETNEQGRPINIEIKRGINDAIDNEAKRLIKLIPVWDVYFRRGEKIEMSWILPIFMEREFYKNKLIKENEG